MQKLFGAVQGEIMLESAQLKALPHARERLKLFEGCDKVLVTEQCR
jgi:hypothetical protein